MRWDEGEENWEVLSSKRKTWNFWSTAKLLFYFLKGYCWGIIFTNFCSRGDKPKLEETEKREKVKGRGGGVCCVLHLIFSLSSYSSSLFYKTLARFSLFTCCCCWCLRCTRQLHTTLNYCSKSSSLFSHTKFYLNEKFSQSRPQKSSSCMNIEGKNFY